MPIGRLDFRNQKDFLDQSILIYNLNMTNQHAPDIIKLLANNLRWKLLVALSQTDLRVQELVEILQKPQNLISYHLQKLSDARLVREHHSIADGREIFYGINLKQIRHAFTAVQSSLHPGLLTSVKPTKEFAPHRILFLCTHNSARSQIAEGLLRSRNIPILEIFSAGTEPLPINPFAVQAMAEFGVDIHANISKDQSLFINEKFDFIVTVCDRARENCPVFPGNPKMIHWSIADPTSSIENIKEQSIEKFRQTVNEIDERLSFFTESLIA